MIFTNKRHALFRFSLIRSKPYFLSHDNVQSALFSSKYKPLSKTHSFLDVAAAVKNDELVINNICQILGQGTKALHASNKIQVNALTEINLEEIKNDYLSTLSPA